MKRLDPWLKILLISLFVVPVALYYLGGFLDYAKNKSKATEERISKAPSMFVM
jgi:hypothetical protein